MPLHHIVLPRLSKSTRLIRGFLAGGLAWYGLTRLVQTALLLCLLIVADPALRATAPYIIFAVVCAALSGVQAYTFVIYAVSCLGTGLDSRGEQGAKEVQLGRA
jgi:hypothetical protein